MHVTIAPKVHMELLQVDHQLVWGVLIALLEHFTLVTLQLHVKIVMLALMG